MTCSRCLQARRVARRALASPVDLIIAGLFVFAVVAMLGAVAVMRRTEPEPLLRAPAGAVQLTPDSEPDLRAPGDPDRIGTLIETIRAEDRHAW